MLGAQEEVRKVSAAKLSLEKIKYFKNKKQKTKA